MDSGELDALLVAVAQGDAAAFERLYAGMHRPVFAVAYSVLHDTGLAEDVMQDAFLAIYAKAGLYRRKGNPSAWIFTVARRLALDKRKHLAREIPLEQEGPERGAEDGPEETVIRDMLLEEAFRVLDDAERQILILHLVAGLKHREIAPVVGCPLGTVLWKYRRGLGKMEQVLREGGEAE